MQPICYQKKMKSPKTTQIETLFSLLKGIYNLVMTKARSVAGYFSGIDASLCAYPFCHQNKPRIQVSEPMA
jgi:hypothetical protein